MKIEDFVHRKEELSHMSRCTSDEALYKPTLKILLHRRSTRCSVVRCAAGSTAMEFWYVLSRVRIQKPRPYSEDCRPYSEASGPYPEDCRPYTEAGRRIRNFIIPEINVPKTEFRKSGSRKCNSGHRWVGNVIP
jgi:hypothetical protein